MSMEVASSTEYLAQPKHSWWSQFSPNEKKLIIIAGISTVLAIAFCISTIAVGSQARYEPDCVYIKGNSIPEKVEICSTAECKRAAAAIRNRMDDTKDACEDFYAFACGKFVPDPPRGTYNHFTLVHLDMIQRLSKIYDSPVPSAEDRNATSIVRHLYKKCMEQETKYSEGLSSVGPLLQSVLNTSWPIVGGQWKEDDFSWSLSMARILREYDQKFFFSFEVNPDKTNPSKFIPWLLVGLPGTGIIEERVYYSDSTDETRIKKVVCMLTSCKVLDSKQLQEDIDQLLNLLKQEQQLFGSSPKNTDFLEAPRPDLLAQRSPTMDIPQFKFTIPELQFKIPDINWKAFFEVIFEKTDVIVNDELQIATILDVIGVVVNAAKLSSKRAQANYIGWKFLENWGSLLSSNISSIMYPYKERQAICRDFLDTVMGFAVGKLYIDKHVTNETIDEVSKVVDDIQHAFAIIVNESDWLDNGTKGSALRKVNNMKKSVASPTWVFNNDEINEHYKELVTIPDKDFPAGATLAKKTYIAKQIELLHNVVDRENDWLVRSPVVVNAFNVRFTNTMLYPLGILDDLMFNNGRPRAVNFGSFGYVAGHEVTHGFDSEGKSLNEIGAVSNWWSQEADEKFQQGAKCFIDQYSSITDDITQLKLNGMLTLAENIADNGGLKAAFKAYKEVGQQQGGRLKSLENYSEDQLFFISAAQTWCSKSSKETMQQLIATSGHSPDKYRAYVPFLNFPEFATAFNCKNGTRMNPRNKCKIW